VVENTKHEMLERLLSRLPGTAWSSRLDPATGKSVWIYVSPQMAEIYGITDAELRQDPLALLKRIVPEDAEKLEKQLANSFATLAPLSWSGRVMHTTGTIRWIETQCVFEHDEKGHVIGYGQALDVTERKKSELMFRSVIEALPIGVTVMDASGKVLVMNAAQLRSTGSPDADGNPDDSMKVFRSDGKTRMPDTEWPIVRALEGKAHENEVILRDVKVAGDVRLWVRAEPMRDDNNNVIAALAVTQDVTDQRRLEEELRVRNEQLAASEEAKTALIERLRFAIDELSNPILEVWDDVLAMPIIGVVDSRRTADMVQRLLAEVARTQANYVIVDLTGVEVVDTKTADHLIKLVRKVEIVGARCVLTGIRPAVSETLVDIGVDFGRLTTLRNLKHGLRDALRAARRDRDGARDLDADPDEEAHTRRRSRSA